MQQLPEQLAQQDPGNAEQHLAAAGAAAAAPDRQPGSIAAVSTSYADSHIGLRNLPHGNLLQGLGEAVTIRFWSQTISSYRLGGSIASAAHAGCALIYHQTCC